jgi:hypothetical protein
VALLLYGHLRELGALLSELAVYEISVQSARDEFRAFCLHARMRDVPCRGRCCLRCGIRMRSDGVTPQPDQPNCRFPGGISGMACEKLGRKPDF